MRPRAGGCPSIGTEKVPRERKEIPAERKQKLYGRPNRAEKVAIEQRFDKNESFSSHNRSINPVRR